MGFSRLWFGPATNPSREIEMLQVTTPTFLRLPVGRLEQLDRIARWIFQENLLAARPSHDIVPKLQTSSAQLFSFRGEVFDDEFDAVPSAWSWSGPVGHRTPGGARWATQEQTKLAPDHIGKSGAAFDRTVNPKCLV